MSVTPAYLHEEAELLDQVNVLTARNPRAVQALAQDGERYLKMYLADAQGIFSRVQHHVHDKTKHGYKPLRACRPKTKLKQS